MYTKNGWIEEYGIAANSSTETTVILKLDRSNGKPETGSYVYALDDSFFVNYARVIKLEKLDNNLLTITLDSEKYPLNSDLTPQDCTDADNYTWIVCYFFLSYFLLFLFIIIFPYRTNNLEHVKYVIVNNRFQNRWRLSWTYLMSIAQQQMGVTMLIFQQESQIVLLQTKIAPLNPQTLPLLQLCVYYPR